MGKRDVPNKYDINRSFADSDRKGEKRIKNPTGNKRRSQDKEYLRKLNDKARNYHLLDDGDFEEDEYDEV